MAGWSLVLAPGTMLGVQDVRGTTFPSLKKCSQESYASKIFFTLCNFQVMYGVASTQKILGFSIC